MKILIIGSEGFIGSNCLRYFSSKSHVVYGADIVENNHPYYFFIGNDPSDYDTLFCKLKPDVCINASGSADVGFSLKYPEKDYELNVHNVERMLKSIAVHSPECKLLNFSSAAVYGDSASLPVKETDATNPLSPYGKHKLQSELLLKEYYDNYKLRTCSLRVFSAYGPGLKKQIFWDIYRKTLAGNTVVLYGTGKESRDFIFIDDLVRAVDSVILNGWFAGEAINVASGTETSIKDAAALLLSFLGDHFSLEFTGEDKAGDPKNWRADISLLKRTGFIPFFTFGDGITKYAEWLKELE